MIELDQILEIGKAAGIGLVAWEAAAYAIKAVIHPYIKRIDVTGLIQDPEYERLMRTPLTYYLITELGKGYTQVSKLISKLRI